MLGLAATWRWRDQAWRAGFALGVLIALKLLFVPLLRGSSSRTASPARWSRAGRGRAMPGRMGHDRLRRVSPLCAPALAARGGREDAGLSSVAYAHSLGLGGTVASAVPYALGCGVIALLWAALRRGGPRADAHGFLLATLAMIAFSPIVWRRYLALLLVPLAVLRPRFGAVWLIPCVLWITPLAAYSPADAASRIVFAAAVLGTVVFALAPHLLASALGSSARSRNAVARP